MKTPLLSYFALLTLFFFTLSCIRDDDDSDKQCSSNCTTIKGRVFRADGKGLENKEVSLHFWLKDEFAYLKRKIGKAFTDSNGYYEMSVFLYDTEIGDSPGILELKINYDDVEVSLTDDFLKPSEVVKYLDSEYDKYRIEDITHKEITLEIDYFIPYKSKKSTIALNNYYPINQLDNFSFCNLIPYGFTNNIKTSYLERGFAETTNNTFYFNTIVGNNTIFILKRKNGEQEKEVHEFTLDNKRDSLNLIYYY